MALFRFLIASVVLAIYYFVDKKARIKLSGYDVLLCFLIGAASSGYILGLNIGEQGVSSPLASFIVSTEPIMIAMIATALLKEKLTLYSITGLLVSILGVSIIFYSGNKAAGGFNWYVLIIFIATFSSAIYCTLQKPLLRRYRARQILPLYMWFSSIVLLPYFPDMIYDIQEAHWEITLVLIYLGIFPTLIAFALWTYAISKIPVGRAAGMFYIIPFFTMIFGYLLLKEEINLLAFLGGCLALIGAVIINLPFIKDKNYD